MLQDDEKILIGLYHRRQELLRELNEIDTKIRGIEIRTSKKERSVEGRVNVEAADSQAVVSRVTELLNGATADQDGYRTAQLHLEEACLVDPEASDDEKARKLAFRNTMLRETFKRLRELMVDPFGNYYVQRVISLLKPNGSIPAALDNDHVPQPEESEVLSLLETIGSDLADVACHMHGTRTVQRLIDVLASPEEFELFSDLVANDLVTMIKDLNGNHAVLRLLLANNFVHLGSGDDAALRERGQNIRKDIYHIIATNCVEICVNRQGCCIIQRCLQSAPEPFRSEIINVALSNVLALVQDPFGNYVIQYVLDLQLQDPQNRSIPNYTNRIIRQMLHHIAALSCNKFGSNVIEKCFKSASNDVRQLLIDELTDPHAMPKLLTDSFANYVVQTAITTAGDDAQFQQLRDAILPLQHLLKNSPYGVKIEAKLQKRAREASKRAAPAAKKKRQHGGGGGGGRGGGGNTETAHRSAGAIPPPMQHAQLQQQQQQQQYMAPDMMYSQAAMFAAQFPQQYVPGAAAALPTAPTAHFPSQQQQPTLQVGTRWPANGYTAVQRLAAQQHGYGNGSSGDADDPSQGGGPTVKVTHSPYAATGVRF